MLIFYVHALGMIDQVNEKNVQFVCVCVVANPCKDMLTPSFSYHNTMYIIILYNPRESTVLHITCTCCIIHTHVYVVNINIVLLLWVVGCVVVSSIARPLSMECMHVI